jgi:colicin import membrane protein
MCSYEGDDSMAKKNLIKSTTQKKADAKAEKKTVTKKSTAKKSAKTTKKSAAKATKKSSATTAKKKAAPAAKKTATKKAAPKKTAAKKTSATKAKAAPKKAKPKMKVSVKELVFKKFEPTRALPEAMPAPKPAAADVSAPPLISSSDPKEVERIRALLFNQFDMDAIKAAAKAPAHDPAPATEAEPEAATAAPTQAPAKVITASDADAEAPAQGPAKVITAPDAEQPADNAYISVEPQTSDSAGDPMNRIVMIAAAAAATVIFLLLAISYNNSTKYYIYPKDNAIEIWKGQFSPKDKAFFMVLHGTPAVEPVKESYTEKDVFPLVFNYLVDKADTLLEVPGLPDFEGIKNYLHQARKYVVGNEMQTAVTTRLNNIERMTLLYKADVALSKDNVEALGSAIGLLKKAGMLTHSSAQEDEIAQKIEQALARLAELKSAAQ